LRNVESAWRRLLSQEQAPEHRYHKFLADHAGLFFGYLPLVISKARLGSDYETDLVFSLDESSAGIRYAFVELESPHAATHTKAGDPSAAMTHAIQQVMNWKRWLKSHRGECKQLFPSVYFAKQEFEHFSFGIFIGRREQSPRRAALRNELAKELGIQIRSFDAFTEMLKLSVVHDLYHDDALPLYLRNQLANPFAKAYSWQAWKEMTLEKEFQPHHFPERNAPALLEYRTCNPLFATFRRIWRTLPKARRDFYLSRLAD